MGRTNVYTYDEFEGRQLAGSFNPGSAEKVDGRCEWNGQNMADVHAGENRWQNLYRTKSGLWVLHTTSAWVREADTWTFVSDADAKRWLLINESDEHVERWFGPLAEESGPNIEAIAPNQEFEAQHRSAVVVLNKRLDASVSGFIYKRGEEYFALNLDFRPEQPYGPYGSAQEAFDDTFGVK